MLVRNARDISSQLSKCDHPADAQAVTRAPAAAAAQTLRCRRAPRRAASPPRARPARAPPPSPAAPTRTRPPRPRRARLRPAPPARRPYYASPTLTLHQRLLHLVQRHLPARPRRGMCQAARQLAGWAGGLSCSACAAAGAAGWPGALGAGPAVNTESLCSGPSIPSPCPSTSCTSSTAGVPTLIFSSLSVQRTRPYLPVPDSHRTPAEAALRKSISAGSNQGWAGTYVTSKQTYDGSEASLRPLSMHHAGRRASRATRRPPQDAAAAAPNSGAPASSVGAPPLTASRSGDATTRITCASRLPSADAAPIRAVTLRQHSAAPGGAPALSSANLAPGRGAASNATSACSARGNPWLSRSIRFKKRAGTGAVVPALPAARRAACQQSRGRRDARTTRAPFGHHRRGARRARGRSRRSMRWRRPPRRPAARRQRRCRRPGSPAPSRGPRAAARPPTAAPAPAARACTSAA
jgi:hypothetical protein